MHSSSARRCWVLPSHMQRKRHFFLLLVVVQLIFFAIVWKSPLDHYRVTTIDNAQRIDGGVSAVLESNSRSGLRNGAAQLSLSTSSPQVCFTSSVSWCSLLKQPLSFSL